MEVNRLRVACPCGVVVEEGGSGERKRCDPWKELLYSIVGHDNNNMNIKRIKESGRLETRFALEPKLSGRGGRLGVGVLVVLFKVVLIVVLATILLLLLVVWVGRLLEGGIKYITSRAFKRDRADGLLGVRLPVRH